MIGQIVGSGVTEAQGARCSISVARVPAASAALDPSVQISPLGSTSIPKRSLPSVPWFGLGTRLQALPSQCSTSVSPMIPGATDVPTAQTSPLAVPSTARRKLSPVPAFALGATVQALPSQCSVSVCHVLLALRYCPTTQASFVPSAVTPQRKLMPLPTLTLGTRVQVLPSQCSVNVCCGAAP